MTTSVSRITIADLAKELRLRPARVIAVARQFGAIVSDASNSIETTLADTIRSHYQLNSSSPARPLSVFLCHSSSDKPAIRELYNWLQAVGISPWFDEADLVGGQDWNLEISKAVRSSDLVIVCLSQACVNQAGYVQKEIKIALDVADEQPESAIFIIPLKLEECTVPSRLSRWQWVNLYEAGGYEKLWRALAARAGEIRTPIQELRTLKENQVNGAEY